MNITTTFYPPDRAAWRKWLEANGAKEREIWLLYPNKNTGRARILYEHAVEEALCFGWIDGQVKKPDADTLAQRFTPRRKGGNWSELNKARARRLIKEGKMTPAGFAALGTVLDAEFQIAPDIVAALKADEKTWANFEAFPDDYQRVRVGFVEDARRTPEIFGKRLANLVKMTAQGKRFGTF